MINQEIRIESLQTTIAALVKGDEGARYISQKLIHSLKMVIYEMYLILLNTNSSEAKEMVNRPDIKKLIRAFKSN